MPWYSGEQIEAARQMTAMEYLRRYQPYRLKKSSARNEWELTDHDSFKINGITSQWHWKSRDIGGICALNFLVKVDGMDFKEAVDLLLRENPVVRIGGKESIYHIGGEQRVIICNRFGRI